MTYSRGFIAFVMLFVLNAVCIADEKESDQQVPEDFQKENKRGQISGSSCGNHVCCGGLSGIPGIPGTPGRAGEAGRDGRDGAPGTFGPQGRTGRRGSASPVGPKGEQGTRGQQGTRGPPGPGAHANWKECTWKNLNDGRDHGKVVVSGPWS